ncbi:hypothetical protein AURDEDRAFT_128084 [Auricularia subglabra TFB-10046 SS5]|uniref:F-box domain-containing protein n=1 Tax=Auricularia subglabra (strain TFB-10046 / SS5) TaxID=717982 RepID=J0WW50_AURST|nr:hypothetical protein AURDEDRAFT_128084 [Auricularia subglabra TFB-10046 SS5]
MAAVTFGSFGDIVAIIQLASQLRTALCDVSGAPAEVKLLGSDLSGFILVLDQARRALLDENAHFEPETRVEVEAGLQRCEDTLRAIQSRVRSFASQFERRNGVKALRAYFAAVAWRFLGGRKEVEELRARLAEHVSFIQLCLSVSQSTGQRALHAAAAELHGATTQRVVEAIQDIQRHFGPGVPSFHFYDERSKTYFQPCARVTLHAVQETFKSFNSAYIGEALCFRDVPSNSRFFLGQMAGFSLALKDRNSPLWAVPQYPAHILLEHPGGRSNAAPSLIECLVFEGGYGELEVLLGVRPSTESASSTGVLLDMLRGEYSTRDDQGLYAAERRRARLVKSIVRDYNTLIYLTTWHAQGSDAVCLTRKLVDRLKDFPDVRSMRSSALIRKMERIRRKMRQSDDGKKWQWKRDVQDGVMSLLEQAPRITDGVDGQSALGEVIYANHMRGEFRFFHSDLLTALFRMISVLPFGSLFLHPVGGTISDLESQLSRTIMSSAAHVEALRPAFASHFKMVSDGVPEAAQIKRLCDELKEASHVLVSELLMQWDIDNNRSLCLPDEILALCFCFLPFRDRVLASHVSRRWRTVSLSHPAVWACIDFDVSVRNRAELFRMALERTGAHPVDIPICPELDEGLLIEKSLVSHMHHIRSLRYFKTFYAAPLLHVAPRLETLACENIPLDIPAEFLGGVAGQLTTLRVRTVSFPKTCPALSTVTNLSLRGPQYAYYAQNLSLLFQLFPVLQSLRFSALKHKFSRDLPAGPVPASLRSLYLHTSDPDYDLTKLYAGWRSDDLSSVDISHNAALSKHSVHLVDAAPTLDVQRESKYETSVITAVGPGSCFRKLEYWEEDDDQSDLAARLVELKSALADVHAISVPATSLGPFLAVFAVLPKLTHVTIALHGKHDTSDTHEFQWDALAPLARLPEHRLDLQSVVLKVVCDRRTCTPAAQDARDLLAQLEGFAHVKLPDITVEGFAPAVLRGVPPPEFPGFHIAFGDGPASMPA